jgi:hypothetical protein
VSHPVRYERREPFHVIQSERSNLPKSYAHTEPPSEASLGGFFLDRFGLQTSLGTVASSRVLRGQLAEWSASREGYVIACIRLFAEDRSQDLLERIGSAESVVSNAMRSTSVLRFSLVLAAES